MIITASLSTLELLFSLFIRAYPLLITDELQRHQKVVLSVKQCLICEVVSHQCRSSRLFTADLQILIGNEHKREMESYNQGNENKQKM